MGNARKAIYKTVQVLYWFPLTAFIISLVLSANIRPTLFTDELRTLIFGLFFAIYAAKLIPFIFYLIADILKIFSKKQKDDSDGKNISRKNFLKKVGLAGGGVMVFTLFTGIFKWAYSFKVRKVNVSPHLFPKSLSGLKIVQLSDIHLGSWLEKDQIDNAIDMVLEQKPDLIFFTGDLVNYKTAEAFPFREQMKRLQAPLGVYTILGNHDYGDYVRWSSKAAKEKNMDELKQFYKDIGWKLLLNENDIISYNNTPLAIIGVQNWSYYNNFPKYGNLKEATSGAEEITAKILLSHDPTHWHYVVKEEWPDIQLTLSGHTHGFQFGIETNKIKWSPSQWMYPEWGGLYSANDKKQHLYVNRGLGTVGYPGRVGILPEITLLEIV